MIQEYVGGPDTKLVSYDKGDVPEDATVHLFGKEDGEWVKKKSALNDGLFEVAYHAGFHGTSELQVRDDDGNVLDEGTLAI